MIHNVVLNFQDRILCYHERFHKIKNKNHWKYQCICAFKQYESYLETCNLNYVDCVPFSYIDFFSYCSQVSQLILKNLSLEFCEKHDQTSNN